MCAEKKLEGSIAAHSVMNVFYILRKEFTIEERRKTLTDLCEILTISVHHLYHKG